MKTLLYSFGVFIILIFISCDPLNCVNCEKPEINFNQFINKSNFTLSSSDSKIIHTFSLIDSTIDKPGEQCDIGTPICEFYNIYIYESKSVDTKFEYVVSYHNFHQQNDSFASMSLELIVQYSPYKWYNYKFQVNHIEYQYKKRREYLDSINLNGNYYYDVLELDSMSIIKKSRNIIKIKFPKIYYTIHKGIVGLIDKNDELVTLQ